MKFFITTFLLLTIVSSHAGVYGDLEYGDDRATVTRKMSASPLVEQTINETLLGRTGLNGIFKCKAELAGLTYHLYFGWDENGGLNEISLRSNHLALAEYGNGLRRAWTEAEGLFSKVYDDPAQKTDYPKQQVFKQHNVLISHVWHRGNQQSILLGPGIKNGKCFLVIRFVNQRVELPPLPKTQGS
ncbi:MAG: hypothetical protein KJO79_02325 [Verrucomicrobiae bacterium]|nr:hypothetical protein [Verrucomicrobiae bacterium]NNJ85990.1 hypothetical protein [Akkermansiaceae bacterium]